MLPLHFLQFFIFTACVHLFTLFSYLIYISAWLSSSFHSNFELEYDFIIVGSGTAGSLIAHRIASETNYTYIVLEAGSKGHTLLDIPVLGPFLHGSIFDWQYETVPQTNACLAMEGRKCRLPQGKIFGGSSKLNNMIHVRGNLSHYVDWFHGKYNVDYIRKTFEFIENNIIDLDNIQYQSHLSNAILESAKELGLQTELGLKFAQGFMKSIVSQRNGKRWSTSDNVDISKHIIFNALVENIFFDGSTASGVTFYLFNKKYKMNARKGVILAAGALNTPKILQLSGIGPQKLLESLGLPVVKNLPVGRNLQDHVASGLDLVLFDKSVSINAVDMLNPLHMIQYFYDGKGPLTTSGCEVIGFKSSKNLTTPDLQFMVLPVGLSSDRGSLFRKTLGINNKAWYNYFTKTFDYYVATILPVVLHPKSKGYVYINSKDPRQPPLIDPKYLSSSEDREILINGLKFVKNFIETKPMKRIGAFLNPNPFPGCENHTIFTDSYLECYIKHLTLTSYHPVGTCSMGQSHSKTTVVDTSFKVLGVNNLYVADASVLPTLPSGNINAAVAMMANLFFDANIGSKAQVNTNIPFCFNNEYIFEYLFMVCYTREEPTS